MDWCKKLFSCCFQPQPEQISSNKSEHLNKENEKLNISSNYPYNTFENQPKPVVSYQLPQNSKRQINNKPSSLSNNSLAQSIEKKLHINTFKDHEKESKIIPEIKIDRQLPWSQNINKRLQNPVSINEVNCQQTFMPISDDQIQYNGLPNIGNTCYLNSMLQLLYSAQKFKKTIISASRSNNQLLFHCLIANVFQDIDKKQTFTKKREDLLSIVKFIQARKPQFSLNKQNDAVELFYLILNLLEQEDKSSSKFNKFKIRYSPYCKCTASASKQIILESYFIKSNEICMTCGELLGYIIHNSGCSLIIFPNSSTSQFLDCIKFINKSKNNLYYENKAFITYYGNKMSGHYIAHRKTPNGWIRINDSSVKYVGKINRISEPIKLNLYQFKPRKN